MGRITVFTSEDINSKQVLKALRRRKLPFEEISLTDHPARLHDLRTLVDTPAVPQVFFNTRHIGGVEKTLGELQKWDQCKQYNSVLERYEAEIAAHVDPLNDRLALSSSCYRVKEATPDTTRTDDPVTLPDGSKVGVRQVTEILKEVLPATNLKYKGTTYSHSFTGQELSSTLMSTMELTPEQTKGLINELLKARIISHVDPSVDDFKSTSKDVYRLQCNVNPELLNSFRIWPQECRKSCFTLVADLHRLLSMIELASLDKQGLLDYVRARSHASYSVFEEAICELQKLSLNELQQLESKEMTALALNLYSVMLRYGFLKIGVPLSELDCDHFLESISFNIGGEIVSLKEWKGIILNGGTCKQGKCTLNIEKDNRLHFALNIGPHSGSKWSVPFSRFNGRDLINQLEMAARVYCLEDRNVRIKKRDGQVHLSSLFKNNRSDFAKHDQDLLQALLGFLSGKKKWDLSNMLTDQKTKVKVVYHEIELGFHTCSGPWYSSKKHGDVEAKGISLVGRLRMSILRQKPGAEESSSRVVQIHHERREHSCKYSENLSVVGTSISSGMSDTSLRS